MNDIKYIYKSDYVDFELVENAVYSKDRVYPLFKAEVSTKLHFKNYNDVKVEILKYPLPVIRLSSTNEIMLTEISGIIENSWINGYSDFLNDIQGRYNKISKYEYKGDIYLVLRNDEFHCDNVIFENEISTLEELGVMSITKELKEVMEELDQNLQSAMNIELMLELMQENTDMKKYIDFISQNVKNEDLEKAFFFDEYVYELFAKNYVDVLDLYAPYKFNQYGRRGIVRFLEQIITGEVHDECRCCLV